MHRATRRRRRRRGPHRPLASRPLLLASVLGLLSAIAPSTASAATGGPDEHGTTWRDTFDGCPREHAELGPGAVVVEAPTGLIGPVELGFTAPFQGSLASRAWISPHGWVAFRDPGGDDGAPRLLPDESAPRLAVAASWDGEAAARVSHESQGDSHEIVWEWTLGGPGVVFTTRLTFERTGDLHLAWDGMGVGTLGDDVVFGYQDATGTQGVTFVQGLMSRDPEFTNPQLERSRVCITQATRLDCSAPLTLACGSSIDVAVGPLDGGGVLAWTCADGAMSGRERVIEITLDEPAALTLDIEGDASDAALVHLPGEECTERTCSQRDVAGTLSIPLLPAGTHRSALDAPSAVSASVRATCEPPLSLTCNGGDDGTTIGALSRIDTWACAPAPLPGPDETRVVALAATSHLVVTLEEGDPRSWVLIADETGSCLAAGLGGTAIFDAPPGRYLVTVDAPAGVSADHRLVTDCGVQLDASAARPVGCGETIAGDTATTPTGPRRIACLDETLGGGASVFALELREGELVTAELLESQPGQRVAILRAADEGACADAGVAGACAQLDAGEALVVVTGPSGSEGPFLLELQCGERRASAAPLAITAIDDSLLGTSCRDLTADGVLRVELTAGATPPSGTLELVVHEDRDGVTGFDAGADVELGRREVAAPPAGTSVTIGVSVDGELPYRGATIGVALIADGGAEIDAFDDRMTCEGASPSISLGAPSLQWQWSTTDVVRDATDVIATPLAIDLTGDGTSEVVAITQDGLCGTTGRGVVRAFDGRTGAELWAATEDDAAAFCNSQPAAADLDGDGRIEIVVVSGAEWGRLVILDAEGRFVRRTGPMPPGPFQAAPAIADLDGDGAPEIVASTRAFRADGSEAFTFEEGGTRGNGGGGSQPAIADLDRDGLPEVVLGPTAYQWDGADGMAIAWRAEGVADGTAAVGQLDDDAPLEVVVAGNLSVTLIDGASGRVQWSIPQPSDLSCEFFPFNTNGAPTIADLDGDGRSEILTVTSDAVTAIDASGELRWMAPIEECSSGITGVTAFDLDADGVMEVIHADEVAVRIFDGRDGREIFTIPTHDSGTALEMPIVADVDGDGRAEIVVGSNRLLDGAGILSGVRAWGSDGWAGARDLWNQNAYHVTNVLDDGRVPQPTPFSCLPPAPAPELGFRIQEPQPLPGEPGPNLTLAVTRLEPVRLSGCKFAVNVVARVGNAGRGAAPATTVSYRDGGVGGDVLASVPVGALAPGEWAEVEHLVVESLSGDSLAVVADDDGTGGSVVPECREDDNACAVPGEEIERALRGHPRPVGPALRATGHGAPTAPEVTATFEWSGDLGAPRGDDEHYHVLRGTDPRALSLLVGLEPLRATSHVDATPRAVDRPRVHFYRVVAANDCEIEEFRP